MEDPNRSYCHWCEGYTDTYHFMAGQPMCTMCGRRKSLIPLLKALDWSPHWEESCDPIGVDDELRAYENDEVE